MYKIISHTTDVGLFVSGATLKELFREAFNGFCDIVFNKSDTLGDGDYIKVVLSADTREGLLVSWLNELNYFILTRGLYLTAVHDLIIEENLAKYKIKCGLSCNPIGRQKKELKTEIKTVTFHQLKIVENGGILSTTIIMDI